VGTTTTSGPQQLLSLFTPPTHAPPTRQSPSTTGYTQNPNSIYTLTLGTLHPHLRVENDCPQLCDLSLHDIKGLNRAPPRHKIVAACSRHSPNSHHPLHLPLSHQSRRDSIPALGPHIIRAPILPPNFAIAVARRPHINPASPSIPLPSQSAHLWWTNTQWPIRSPTSLPRQASSQLPATPVMYSLLTIEQ
jgi:hypothetical protein